MIVYLMAILVVVLVYNSDSPGKGFDWAKITKSKSTFVIIGIVSIIYWGVISMHYSCSAEDYSRKGLVNFAGEYNKFPITALTGEFVNKNIVSPGIFLVNIIVKTNSRYKYCRIYPDGSKRLDNLRGDSRDVFIYEDATIKTAYVASLRIKPKVSLIETILLVPPFFVGEYKTYCWAVHIPPNSLVEKFKI